MQHPDSFQWFDGSTDTGPYVNDRQIGPLCQMKIAKCDVLFLKAVWSVGGSLVSVGEAWKHIYETLTSWPCPRPASRFNTPVSCSPLYFYRANITFTSCNAGLLQKLCLTFSLSLSVSPLSLSCVCVCVRVCMLACVCLCVCLDGCGSMTTSVSPSLTAYRCALTVFVFLNISTVSLACLGSKWQRSVSNRPRRRPPTASNPNTPLE